VCECWFASSFTMHASIVVLGGKRTTHIASKYSKKVQKKADIAQV
jgi:hypothetical protein